MTKALEVFGIGLIGFALGSGAMHLAGRVDSPKPQEPLQLQVRPLDHLYGSIVTVELPGVDPASTKYFRWCDEGFLIFSNGFKEDSPLTVIRDARCDGVK